jgi:Ricin-type beta-trefoil lectin domain
MPTHDPAAGREPGTPPPPTSTVYGAGGVPLTQANQPGQGRAAPGPGQGRSAAGPGSRWLMPAACAVGAFGVLVGLALGLGLTPFTPGKDAPAAQPAPKPANPGQTADGGAAGATTAPSPSPSPSAPPARVLRSVLSSMCLQSAPNEDPQGADVQQLPCTGAAEQRWLATPAGDDRFTIVNTGADRCLDVHDSSKDDAAPVILWRCHGRSNQVWRIVPAGPNFTLVNVNSDKCLDVPGARVEEGLAMQQFTCNSTNAQQWTFAD